MARRATTTEISDVPRHDVVEGWPAPEQQTDWLGAPEAEATLLDAYRGGAMHHAWLLTGPRGIGKATLAYRFARFVLANPNPDELNPQVTSLALGPDHPVVAKVGNRAHTNLLILERPWDEKGKKFRTELTVPVIRRTIPFFGTTSGEGDWRIAIVDAADDMNHNAANALLKVLEEPPARSLFLIVSHAPGRLLPTIRSRCRRLALQPLEPEIIRGALSRAEAGADEGAARLSSALAGGSLRRAALFLEGGSAELFGEFSRLAANAPSSDVAGIHAFADKVAARGKDEAWRSFVEIAEGWLNRRVRRADEPEGGVPVSPEVAAAPLERWAEVWDNLRRSVAETDTYNLDRKSTALTVMFSIARAARM